MLDRRLLDWGSLLNHLDHRSLLPGERRFIVVETGDADVAGGRCYDRLRDAGGRTRYQEREARDESRGQLKCKRSFCVHRI